MTRLDSIVIHQRNTRVRDAFFAAVLALAAIVSISSVSTAVHAASVSSLVTR